MILMLASGLAIWKPVQFGWLTWLFTISKAPGSCISSACRRLRCSSSCT